MQTKNRVKTGRWKYSIFLLVLIYCVSGCKKNGDADGDGPDDAEFYISFNANGVKADYRSNAFTQLLPISPKKLYSGVLQGYGDFTVTDKNLMSIVIWSENPIVSKTYRNSENAVNSDNDKVPQILITYLDKDKNSYLSQTNLGLNIPPFDKIVSDVQVTITAVDQNRVSGTFSGTLYKTTDATFSSTVKITDGKFNLKRL